MKELKFPESEAKPTTRNPLWILVVLISAQMILVPIALFTQGKMVNILLLVILNSIGWGYVLIHGIIRCDREMKK